MSKDATGFTDLSRVELLIVGSRWTLKLEPRRSVTVRHPLMTATSRVNLRTRNGPLSMHDLPSLLAIQPESVRRDSHHLSNTLRRLGEALSRIDPLVSDPVEGTDVDEFVEALRRIDGAPLTWMGGFAPGKDFGAGEFERAPARELARGRIEVGGRLFLLYRLAASRIGDSIAPEPREPGPSARAAPPLRLQAGQ